MFHTWVICIKEVQISFILKHVVGLQCWSVTPQIWWHATFEHRWTAECSLSYHESKILSIKTMETAPHWSKCHPLLWGMVLYNITYSKLKAKVTEAPSVLLSKVSPSLFIWAASLLCFILIVLFFFLLKCDKRHPSMQPLDLSLTLLTFILMTFIFLIKWTSHEYIWSCKSHAFPTGLICHGPHSEFCFFSFEFFLSVSDLSPLYALPIRTRQTDSGPNFSSLSPEWTIKEKLFF